MPRRGRVSCCVVRSARPVADAQRCAPARVRGCPALSGGPCQSIISTFARSWPAGLLAICCGRCCSTVSRYSAPSRWWGRPSCPAMLMPLVLRHLVDELGHPAATALFPVFLVLAYALLRFLADALNEARDVVFSIVTQRTVAATMMRGSDAARPGPDVDCDRAQALHGGRRGLDTGDGAWARCGAGDPSRTAGARWRLSEDVVSAMAATGTRTCAAQVHRAVGQPFGARDGCDRRCTTSLPKSA